MDVKLYVKIWLLVFFFGILALKGMEQREDASKKMGWTPLHTAAWEGDTPAVKTLLDIHEVDVNAQDAYDWTPLHWAARRGNEAVFKVFLSAQGINVNAVTKDGRTALHVAVEEGHRDIVEALLEVQGIKVNVQNENGMTPLHVASQNGHESVIKALLSVQGIDVYARDKDGRTPLDVATSYGRAVMMGTLDPKEINFNISDKKGRTLLHLAAKNGQVAVIETLLNTNGINFDVRDRNGWTLLHVAAKNGHEIVVKALLRAKKGIYVNARDIHGRTPLYWAALHGRDSVVKTLFNVREIDVNTSDNDGWTPLHAAALMGHEAVVKTLTDVPKINVNALDINGRTPLHEAAEKGHGVIIKILLNAEGINIDVKDNDDRTPWNSENVTEEILEAVARVIRDKSGGTPLHWAVWEGDIAGVKTMLDAREIDVNAPDTNGQTPLHWAATRNSPYYRGMVKILLSAKEIDVNARDKAGQTPLHKAAMYHDVDAIRILLRASGIDVKVADKDGKTALHVATMRYYYDIRTLLSAKEIDVDAQDKNGWTPLYEAAGYGNEKTVKALLAAGASVNSIMQRGILRSDVEVHRWTPLHRAVHEYDLEIVKILLNTVDSNVNAISEEGLTPLDIAVQRCRGNTSIIRELLLHGGKLCIDENGIKLQKLFENQLLISAAIRNTGAVAGEIETIKQALPFAIGQGNVEMVEHFLSLLHDELPFSEMIDHVTFLLKHSITDAQRAAYQKIIKLLGQAGQRAKVCSICCDTFYQTPELKTKTLDCVHKFHAQCINRWLEMKQDCPDCRAVPGTIDSESLDKKLMAVIAARKENACEEIEELLKRGADSNYDKQGITPFCLAVLSNRTDIVRLLLKYMNINPIKDLQKCLLCAAETKLYEMMTVLIDAGAIVDIKNRTVVDAMTEVLRQDCFMLMAVLGNQGIGSMITFVNDVSVIKKALLFAIAQGHVDVVANIVKELVARNKFDANEFSGHANLLLQRCRNEEYVNRYKETIEIIERAHTLIPQGIPVNSLPAAGFNS